MKIQLGFSWVVPGAIFDKIMVEQTANRGGSGWTGSSWPESPGTADTTTWGYHEGSGLLTSKQDAASKSVSYTYSTGGKLATRTWSRTNGTNSLVTTYSYGTAGDLTGIEYSDSTPDVSFTYDRLGRQKTAESSVSAHTFAYSGLQLDTETIISDGTTNVIDRSYDAYGRPTGFNLGSEYQVAYGYDSLGRFSSVDSSNASHTSYSYLPNSDLISIISNNEVAATRTYEDHRNLLTQVENKVGATSVSRFDYQNDAGGRRTSVKHSGTAFDAGAVFNLYGYNSRSEVTNGNRYWGANLGDTSDPVAGQGFAYAYDNIGNRTAASRDNEETTYTANSLNQYSQRTVADLIDILGSAETNATVKVNNLAANRHGKYWHKGITVTNSSSAAWQGVEVIGICTNSTNTYYSVETGNVFIAKTPEIYTHDDDGNLLSDGRFNFTWDAENRLTSAETLTNLPASVPRVKVDFAYDYMSRRVSKTISNWNSCQGSVKTSH